MPLQNVDGVVIERDHPVAAVGLGVRCLYLPAALHELGGDGEEVSVEVRLRSWLPHASPRRRPRNAIRCHIANKPVFVDEVEVGAGLLGRPDHLDVGGRIEGEDLLSDRVVLLQRSQNAKFAQWMRDLPVGKSGPGEPITETAVRELCEETGLNEKPEAPKGAHILHGARGVEAPNSFLTYSTSPALDRCGLGVLLT